MLNRTIHIHIHLYTCGGYAFGAWLVCEKCTGPPDLVGLVSRYRKDRDLKEGNAAMTTKRFTDSIAVENLHTAWKLVQANNDAGYDYIFCAMIGAEYDSEVDTTHRTKHFGYVVSALPKHWQVRDYMHSTTISDLYRYIVYTMLTEELVVQ